MPSFNIDMEELAALDLGAHTCPQCNSTKNSSLTSSKSTIIEKNTVSNSQKTLAGGTTSTGHILLRTSAERIPREGYLVAADREADSDLILSSSVMRKQHRNYDVYIMNEKLSHEQAAEQGTIRIKVRGQHREFRIENQRIMAGALVNLPVSTGRYKYLPNSSPTKRISS